MPTSQRKSHQLKVSVTPELYERLREVAAQLGQAPATVASLAIGQYVAHQRAQLGAIDKATQAMADQVGVTLKEEIRQLKLKEETP
jgi:predicted transcriptional regulator